MRWACCIQLSVFNYRWLHATIAVARAGIEPATFRFSGGRSYQLSYLAGRHPN